ncbi:hypothetical protein P154DRAFT_519160 [Amniculicola lignicola CBS 123094]|uniref:Uncharacterized protein n=1 Tax=Amniculicola lignicola CBS 123094 TaxID=1392246 RepID=A0A6A5WS44_9PLEO|nr:hypothetical protein P154DRAFT_519160 [Amniculicola lignicola CBS 123094]
MDTSPEDEISRSPTSPTDPTVSRASTAVCNDAPPFSQNAELCKTLRYAHRPSETKSRCLLSDDPTQMLPDAPRIPLDSCKLVSHCLSDLDVTPMQALGEKLWWAGPTDIIRPLSEHTTIERRIHLTEDPTMHCVWTNGTIFIKPLPLYLCSYAFWEYLLDPLNDGVNPEEREKLKLTSLGFLKTYAHLIQHRSDFNLARRLDLLCSFDGVDFETFSRFIMAFEALPNGDVSIRWRFGELHLDTLNFYSAIFLRKWHRQRFENRYGTYFSRFFPVILFVFALLSVILSAMQVITGSRQMWETDNKGLKRTLGIFEWFATEAIAWSLAFGGLFFFWWIGMSIADACRMQKTKKGLKKRLSQEATTQP